MLIKMPGFHLSWELAHSPLLVAVLEVQEEIFPSADLPFLGTSFDTNVSSHEGQCNAMIR